MPVALRQQDSGTETNLSYVSFSLGAGEGEGREKEEQT